MITVMIRMVKLFINTITENQRLIPYRYDTYIYISVSTPGDQSRNNCKETIMFRTLIILV